MDKPLRIGLVAGEHSGDLLGASLITALKRYFPDAIYEGIAGPAMAAAGCQPIEHTESLSVMGIFEIIKHLPRIWRVRRKLLKHFVTYPPDVFIGIDAPDFNLGVEQRLRRQGVPTVHYNSPTVWAWRQGRMRKIAQSTSLMLTLYPFETAIYEQHQVPARFIGHPMADEIPMHVDQVAARQRLGLAWEGQVVALLPGSRAGEVKQLADVFLKAASWCRQQRPGLSFVVPAANPARREQFQAVLNELNLDLPMTLVDGQAREVMAAADVVLLASGTATLECMLLKRPMVVAYKVSALTYQLLKRLIKVPFVSLPNLLAGKELVPELLQAEATPEQLGAAVLAWLDRPTQTHELLEQFAEIHKQLAQNASEQAAAAIKELLCHN